MTLLKLVPFSEENLLTVLAWRNSERIRSNMLDDSIISEVSHRVFLKSLATDYSKAYFVVELNCNPVASVYLINLGGAEVTWGCYIGAERIIPGLFVALLVIASKFAFSWPETRILKSEVAAHNSNPIKLNKFLGITEIQRVERPTASGKNIEFIEYQLNRSELKSVLAKASKIMPSAIKEATEKFILESKMQLRKLILELFDEALESSDAQLECDELKDDTVLLNSGLDSLGFAILVARLEEELGFDPFVELEGAVYPTTFGEFVAVYENRTDKG